MSTLNLEHIKHENSSTNNITVDSDGSVAVNRHTSNGTIINLKKDGTSVGSIGVINNQATFGTGDTAFVTDAGSDAIYPWNVDTNTSRDNALDLGAAAVRWKNLYLSGGVYLGGTGSANLLDDYEEGTWTPTSLVNGFTVSLGYFNAARYVKIGKIVHVTFDMVFGSVTYASSYSLVGGLPYGAATTAVNGWYSSGTISGNAAGGPIYIGSGTTSVYLFQGINSNTTTTWNVGFTYETS